MSTLKMPLLSVAALVLLLAPEARAEAVKANLVGEYQAGAPVAIAVDENGNIYAAQPDGTIIVLDKGGTQRARLTCRDENGKAALKALSGMTYYNGALYITDSILDRLVICSKDGKYIDGFGEGGSRPKQFKDPEDVFVRGGVIYVADSGNGRVQIFSPDGVYMGSTGNFGEGDMRSAVAPLSVALDGFGNVYIADGKQKKVISLKPDLRHNMNFVGLEKPARIEVTGDGLYVADRGKSKVLKYDLRGNLLLALGDKGGEAQFPGISDIEVDPDGRLYVSDSNRGSVQVFVLPGPQSGPPPGSPPTYYRWKGDVKAAADRIRFRGGALYALSSGKGEIEVIREGKVERTIRAAGLSPAAFDVDREGFVWVVDRVKARFFKLGADGNVILGVGGPGKADGLMQSPTDIAVSAGGTVYVSDTGNNRVQRFGTDGTFRGVLDKRNTFALERPTSLALAGDGRLFILDEKKKLVAVYSQEGNPMYSFGKPGERPGQFKDAADISLSADEALVLDRGAARIHVFGLNGSFHGELGAEGSGKGDFKKPSSIATDGDIIYVADTGNERVQALEAVHTPSPPSSFSVSAGMRQNILRWDPSPESFVAAYKVYKSENKASGYVEIAATELNSLVDSEVIPGKKYYYCVSAVSSGGNESAKTCGGFVAAAKYKVAPPKGLAATSSTDSIDLLWQPAEDPLLSHYLVYRRSKGEFKEVARVTSPSYKDGGLLPDVGYEYIVTTVSIDDLESERTSTISARTLPDKAVPVEVEVLDQKEVFWNAAALAQSEGIGRARVINNTGETLTGLTVSFMMAEVMASPAKIEIKELAPGEVKEVVLRPVFTPGVLNIVEDMPVQAEIRVDYFRNEEQRERVKTFTIRTYEKHRLRWDRPEMLGALVTPSAPPVAELAKKVSSQYPGEGDPLVYAAAMFDALGASGLAFREPQDRPYKAASAAPGEVDSVQFPEETLVRKSGDSDDLAALYSALLEAQGMKTALLILPETVLPMFYVNMSSGQAPPSAANMFVEHDGLLWAPVDMRLVGGPFMKAWESGSQEYARWRSRRVMLVEPRRAWENFKPYALYDTGWRPETVHRATIEEKFIGDFAAIKKIRIENMTSAYVERLKADQADVDAAVNLSAIYAEFGLLDEALGVIEDALSRMPKDAALRNNLGNIRFLSGSYEEARKAYETAASLDPDDAYILVNLARCYRKLGNKEEASRLFRKAAKMNKEVFKKYKKLSMELM